MGAIIAEVSGLVKNDLTPDIKKAPLGCDFTFKGLAEWTGLEPATPCVTGRYSNQLNYHSADFMLMFDLTNSKLRSKQKLAEWTGLEPATPCVTGRYSNQLNYHSV